MGHMHDLSKAEDCFSFYTESLGICIDQIPPEYSVLATEGLKAVASHTGLVQSLNVFDFFFIKICS